MLNTKYYSTTESAEILGVSRITVFNWIKNKKIKATKHAGNYLISEEELDGLKEKSHLHQNDKNMLRAFSSKVLGEYLELLYSIE